MPSADLTNEETNGEERMSWAEIKWGMTSRTGRREKSQTERRRCEIEQLLRRCREVSMGDSLVGEEDKASREPHRESRPHKPRGLPRNQGLVAICREGVAQRHNGRSGKCVRLGKALSPLRDQIAMMGYMML